MFRQPLIPDAVARRETRQTLQQKLEDRKSELERVEGEAAPPLAPPARAHALPKAGGPPGPQPGTPVLARQQQLDSLRAGTQGVVLSKGQPKPTPRRATSIGEIGDLAQLTGIEDLEVSEGRVATIA